ncbi:MAG TPA: hypothetical protein VFC44_02595 [Candidatus Saccharimonadales bacterium]|nr:hypothetical protein [Candidatus Saccharimonadales bacterium]
MKTRVMDSPAKRVSIAVAVVTAVILAVAAGFTFFGGSAQPVNGPKIVAAAQAYTRALRAQHLPVPLTVSLQDLIDRGFLQAKDAGLFQGMDAVITLVAQNDGPQTPLIRVHMSDGTDLLLMGDGSTEQVKR